MVYEVTFDHSGDKATARVILASDSPEAAEALACERLSDIVSPYMMDEWQLLAGSAVEVDEDRSQVLVYDGGSWQRYELVTGRG